MQKKRDMKNKEKVKLIFEGEFLYNHRRKGKRNRLSQSKIHRRYGGS